MGIRIGWRENEQRLTAKKEKELQERDWEQWHKQEIDKFISEYGNKCQIPYCDNLVNRDNPKRLTWGLEDYDSDNEYVESRDLAEFIVCDNCYQMLHKIFETMRGSVKNESSIVGD
jgi:hypothetical protein